MKYSIIIPTFNSEKWIKQCVNSVLAQTDPHFDLIILDGGSTDGTLGWIRSLTDKRIRIYAAEKRLNILENWARITSVPRNEFMTILGHDDILYPGYLAVVDELIAKHPAAGLYQTHFNFIDGEGKVIRQCKPMESTITGKDFLEKVLQNAVEVTATGFMVRTADYDKTGGIPLYPNLLYADIEMVMQFIKNSYLAVAPEITYEFRFHINNTSKSGGENRLTAFEMFINYLKEIEKESEAYKAVIQKNVLDFLDAYVIGSCHKLIYIPVKNREGITMNRIIEVAKRSAQTLSPGINFSPEKKKEIILGKLVDSNSITRAIFLFYKSFKQRTF